MARLGGDEFAVLLPETPVAVAESVLERLSVAVGEKAPHCLGIATAPQQGAGFDDLYRKADTALYEQKLVRPKRQDSSHRVESDPARA